MVSIGLIYCLFCFFVVVLRLDVGGGSVYGREGGCGSLIVYLGVDFWYIFGFVYCGEEFFVVDGVVCVLEYLCLDDGFGVDFVVDDCVVFYEECFVVVVDEL